MQRRSFFKLIAGAMLLPIPAIAAPVRFLWGDGIHDDAAALQALLDGEVVEFSGNIDASGCGWVHDKKLVVPRGDYFMGQEMCVRGLSGVWIDLNGSSFRAKDGLKVMISVTSGSDVHFSNGYFYPARGADNGFMSIHPYASRVV